MKGNRRHTKGLRQLDNLLGFFINKRKRVKVVKSRDS